MEFSSTSCKIHSYLEHSFISIKYIISTKNCPACSCTCFYLRIYQCTSSFVKRDYQPTRFPATAPCNKRMKSYFIHTYPSLRSLVPTLSPLLVRFLRVYLQADSSRLLVATAACKHQSRLMQSSSKRSYNITDLRMKPPTMPYGNDGCTQARFAVTHAHVRSSSGSFFPRLVLCVFGLRP